MEKLLSEAVMRYWTNFAKTGNPKAPWKDQFLTLGTAEWKYYDIDWPEFNARNQSYLNMGIPPAIGYQYRQKYMKFWNYGLPEELTRTKMTKPFSPYPGLFTTTPNSIFKDSLYYPDGHLNLFPHHQKTDRTTEDPFRAIKGLMGTQAHDHHPINLHGPHDEPKEIASASSTDSSFYILIAVIVLFFIGNVVLLFGYLWKKGIRLRKLKRNFKRNYDDTNTDGVTDDDIKRSKLNETDDSFILDIVRKSGNNTYEPVKTSYSPINGFKLTRQTSTSTVDPHTKVVDWMAHEITKYSPKITKKITSMTAQFSPSNGARKPFMGRAPKKVSVGIDATPQGRSDSVLRQEPIEITKSKSFDYPMCEEESSTTMSDGDSFGPPQINHKHSHSDPVPMYFHHRRNITARNDQENVTSFIDEDINVTSRDEVDYIHQPMSPEDALITIQRRNYPKVLPDFPPEEDDVSMAMKRRSLPAHSFSSGFYKIPPAPPPRTTSTLDRKGSARRHSNNMTTSPLMIAEEPPDVQEPEITSNTLIVGPLIPKTEGIYSTIKRNKTLSGNASQNFQTTETEFEGGTTTPQIGSGEFDRKKNEFMSKLKSPAKIIVKPATGVSMTSTPTIANGELHIPRVVNQSPPTMIDSGSGRQMGNTVERNSPSDSSSSNETECSVETVKPKHKGVSSF